jgi:hypothetical protein
MPVFKKIASDNGSDCRQYIVQCNCGSVGHDLVLTWWRHEETDSWDTLFVSTRLAMIPRYRRIWLVIRFIFGYQDETSEMCLGETEIDGLISALEESKKDLFSGI